MKCANRDDVKLLGITIDLFNDQNRLYTHDFKKKKKQSERRGKI